MEKYYPFKDERVKLLAETAGFLYKWDFDEMKKDLTNYVIESKKRLTVEKVKMIEEDIERIDRIKMHFGNKAQN